MKNRYSYYILLFSIFYLFLNGKLACFIIAEKSGRGIMTDNLVLLTEKEKGALKYNKYNPLYRLNIGCFYAQMDSINSDELKQIMFKEKLNLHYIDSSLIYLKEAYLMYPDEPVFALNYSLAELFKGNTVKSIDVLKSFEDIEDNILELQCVLGLEYEITGNDDMATYVYSSAVTEFPVVLWSDFFEDLKKRDSLMAFSVLDTAANNLEALYDRTNDPIVASKMGIIAYALGEREKAERLMMEAVNNLPSLNRPWYYLGLISEEKGDMKTALMHFKKSYSLDRNDQLPLKKLVAYEEEDAQLLILQKQNRKSEQGYRLKRIFGGRVIENPFFVSDLNEYCRFHSD